MIHGFESRSGHERVPVETRWPAAPLAAASGIFSEAPVKGSVTGGLDRRRHRSGHAGVSTARHRACRPGRSGGLSAAPHRPLQPRPAELVRRGLGRDVDLDLDPVRIENEQLTQADPLVWQARLEEIACHRQLGDTATARRRLDALLESKEAPPEVILKARAEQIRLALVLNRLDISLQTAQADRKLAGMASAELDLAALEAFSTAWKFAEQDKQASALGG